MECSKTEVSRQKYFPNVHFWGRCENHTFSKLFSMFPLSTFPFWVSVLYFLETFLKLHFVMVLRNHENDNFQESTFSHVHNLEESHFLESELFEDLTDPNIVNPISISVSWIPSPDSDSRFRFHISVPSLPFPFADSISHFHFPHAHILIPTSIPIPRFNSPFPFPLSRIRKNSSQQFLMAV